MIMEQESVATNMTTQVPCDAPKCTLAGEFSVVALVAQDGGSYTLTFHVCQDHYAKVKARWEQFRKFGEYPNILDLWFMGRS